MHLLDGSFYVLGMSIVSFQTILPVFVKELGGTPLAIGSVQVLWMIGQNFPSMFVAHVLQRRRLFRGPMVWWGLAHRGMLLVCAVTALFTVGNSTPEVSVPLFLFLIFLIPAIGSFSGLPWFQVFTKTVPVTVRGRLMGIRQLLGSAAGAVGGSIVAVVLATVAFPVNYAVLFFCAFLFTMVSFYYLVRIIEPPSAAQSPDRQHRPILSEVRRVLSSDRNFRLFLASDIFFLMSMAVSSFYAVNALERFALPASTAGTFTAVIMITNIAANILFGVVGDAHGHKMNLVIMSGASFGAALFAVVATDVLMYGAVFIFMACATQIQSISRLAFIAELCSEQDRPVYVGVVNTLTAPTVLLGLLFGWLVPSVGYASIFITASLLAVISFLILYRAVTEPRNSRT